MVLPESSDKTQIIDTQTWENIGGLLPLLKEKNTTSNGSNDHVDNNSLGAVIVGSIGGIVGFFVILGGLLFVFYRRKLKRGRPPSIITDPIFINPKIYFDSTSSYHSNDAFYHSQQADDSTTRLTGNLNLNQMVSMDMVKQENRSIDETIFNQPSK